jgi:predicted HAD superfamily phosphohydrolase
MGLASTNLGDLRPILDAWQQGGKDTVKRIVREEEKEGEKGDRENFHWLVGRKNLEEPLQIHKRIRRIVREEAGKLG